MPIDIKMAGDDDEDDVDDEMVEEDGLDDNWKINFVKPSSMKIIQKLKTISSFWDLIIDSLDIDPEFYPSARPANGRQ
eukprot:gene25006-28269_t